MTPVKEPNNKSGTKLNRTRSNSIKKHRRTLTELPKKDETLPIEVPEGPRLDKPK